MRRDNSASKHVRGQAFQRIEYGKAERRQPFVRMVARGEKKAVDAKFTGDLRVVSRVANHHRAVWFNAAAPDEIFSCFDLARCENVSKPLCGVEQVRDSISSRHSSKRALLGAGEKKLAGAGIAYRFQKRRNAGEHLRKMKA